MNLFLYIYSFKDIFRNNWDFYSTIAIKTEKYKKEYSMLAEKNMKT